MTDYEKEQLLIELEKKLQNNKERKVKDEWDIGYDLGEKSTLNFAINLIKSITINRTSTKT